jgi:hypothetical protein
MKILIGERGKKGKEKQKSMAIQKETSTANIERKNVGLERITWRNDKEGYKCVALPFLSLPPPPPTPVTLITIMLGLELPPAYADWTKIQSF